ncbi:MAG: lipid-A-disaccharide synthase [Bacteriovorax sp. MedPE-SWde]|nr:MAG: lipid-A-disaccharide synthase [Bacteriovorax sp. MedPE-SWde]
MKSCLLIAGEKSGEEHALSFYKELRDELPDVEFFGVGGDDLKKEGLDLVYNLRDFSTWGISQAIKKVPYYLKALKTIESEVERRNCKTAILIDYQTFNLKLAVKLQKKGVKILYYVAPQAWAWKAWRAKVLEKCVDTLFCIVPFEKKWFMQRGVSKAVSIKHPLLTHYEKGLKEFKRERKNLGKEKVNLLLLPGSRNFEVFGLLPIYAKVAKQLKKKFSINISIVKSSSVSENGYLPYEDLFDKVYTNEDLEEALKESDICMAASGTVNLACALYEVPTVVGYTGSLLNEYIYYQFVNYKGYISLANIVHDKEVFPEMIVPYVTEYNVLKRMLRFFENTEYYNGVMDDLAKTQETISGEDINIPSYMANKIRESYEY